MENDPILEVTFGGEPFEINRRNTFLYTFLGELAIYDHAFVVHDEENSGWYIFKTHMTDGYNMIAQFMVENEFTMHLFAQEVSQGDVDCWKAAMIGDLDKAEDVIEQWNGEE